MGQSINSLQNVIYKTSTLKQKKGFTKTQKDFLVYTKTCLRNNKVEQLSKFQEVVAFLKSGNQHELLFNRHHPLANVNELEKVKLAARRVGLESPE